jgi:hypothetical protein
LLVARGHPHCSHGKRQKRDQDLSEELEIERAEDERIDEALRSGELSVLDYFADVLRRNLRDG